MAQEQDQKLSKLRSGIFQKTDIVELDMKSDALFQKGLSDDRERLLRESGLYIKFETVLKAGPTWKFNPTNLSLFIHDNEFKYNSDLLIKDIADKGIFTCKEIDKNLELYEVNYSVRLLQLNTHFLNDDVIINSEYICVETLAGRMIL
jgi:hypothetical protein